MIKPIIKYILLFLVCLLLQVVLFNHIQLGSLFNPSFYILFILLLPFETPKWTLLLTAFLIGLGVDAFQNTPGMHAAASVVIAFARPGILNMYAPRDGYETGVLPRLSELGLAWFIKYSLSMVLIHQLWLFFVEAFTLRFFWDTLFHALINTLISFVLIILSQFIFFRH